MLFMQDLTDINFEFNKWYQVMYNFDQAMINFYMNDEYFGLKKIFTYKYSNEDLGDAWKIGSIGFSTFGLNGITITNIKS